MMKVINLILRVGRESDFSLLLANASLTLYLPLSLLETNFYGFSSKAAHHSNPIA